MGLIASHKIKEDEIMKNIQEKKVLIVATSADRLVQGQQTGIWLEEFAVPYAALKGAGLQVDVASVAGGKVPLDPHSLEDKEQVRRWADEALVLEHTLPVSAVKADDYDAVFFPGGHGTMMDFPENAAIKHLLNQFAVQGKVIAAVCHGPAALVGARKANGEPLVAGKTITAFTDAEEKAVGLDRAVPFLLESRLRGEGALFVNGPDWAPHVEVDGTLITGQNPASSEGVAQALAKVL